MKKVLSLFLALTLCVALAVPALADGNPILISQNGKRYYDAAVNEDSGDGWSFSHSETSELVVVASNEEEGWEELDTIFHDTATLTLSNFEGDYIGLTAYGHWGESITLVLADNSVNVVSPTHDPYSSNRPLSFRDFTDYPARENGYGSFIIRGTGKLVLKSPGDYPAFQVDGGNITLEEPLRLTGGIKEGDNEPLTLSNGCARMADGTAATYVEISPSGAASPSVPPVSAPTEELDPHIILPTQFSDVPEGAYYADAVKWAVDKGVTKGVSETNFAPAETCTRGQVATFLWRAKGCPEPETTENPFEDVDPSGAFYKAILWAAENGITSGTSETTFSPGNPCTRAHVVTFLWRSRGKPEASGDAPLADSFPQGYYTDAVRWADSAGLLSGTGEEFAPSALCPRADIVTYLYRVLT